MKPNDLPLFKPWTFIVYFAASLLIAYLIAGNAPDFKDLALGDTTKSVYGKFEGEQIFYGNPSEGEISLKKARLRNLKYQLLWLGNSQLHAINQPGTNDLTAPIILAMDQRPRGVEIQAMSFPNASLKEFYLAYLFQKRNHRIDILILPLFLDDTRESKVRSDIISIAKDSEINLALSKTAIGRQIVSRFLKDSSDSKSDKLSLQFRCEDKLTTALESTINFQTMRQKASGQIEIWLYNLRNTLFGITAQTIRRIIPEIYAENMQALREILLDAAVNGTHVILYIPPIRQDVTIPYDQKEYSRFKTEIKSLAIENSAYFIDLDNIVHSRHWGTKQGTKLGVVAELDFMHFQTEGHVVVAAAMKPFVESLTGGGKK